MKWTPKRHQERAIRFLRANNGGALFLDPGLGKTSVALSAIRDWSKEGPALVIAPRRIIEGVWMEEARKWDHLSGLRLSMVHGARKREALWRDDADVKLTTPDMASFLAEEFRAKSTVPFGSLWIDESTKFKSHATKRFKALSSFSPRIRKRVVMSGTPNPEGIADLWSQIKIIDNGLRLGKTVSAFRRRWFRAVPSWNGNYTEYEAKAGAAEEVNAAVKDICLRMSAEDWIELPPLIHAPPVPIHMGRKAEAAYRTMKNDYFADIEDGAVTAMNAAAACQKLRQMANGFAYDGGEARWLHEAKLRALRELDGEIGHEQAIIAYWYKADLEKLRRMMPGTPDLSAENSARLCREWNDGRLRRVFAHPQSAGYGLNLQGAGGPVHIVWHTLTWSLEQYQQMNARAHRQGARSAVVAHHLASAGTIDEAVYRSVLSKGRAMKDFLSLLKAAAQ